MILELFEIYYIEGHLAIKLSALKKIVKFYSDHFLLSYLKKLLKKGIRFAYKWKKNWYVLIPKTPITTSIDKPFQETKDKTYDVNFELPNGTKAQFNWQQVLNNSPPEIKSFFLQSTKKIVFQNNQLFLVGFYPATSDLNSSTLSPKNLTSPKLLSSKSFPATTEYKYGYYIKYKETRMSTFDPGTSGLLSSTQLPAAFFEVCRALDAAENARNGANPGLAPQRNISTTVSFDTGTIAVAATLPITVAIGAGGKVDITASDYLGAGYADFDVTANGDGDLTSDTLPEVFVEIATLLSNAEKAVTPAENQPDNVQVSFDLEEGLATVSANLPFNSDAAANGDVTVHAIDYLP